MGGAISIEDQISAQKVLDRMYETYKKTGDFAMIPGVYEAIYGLLSELVGGDKLWEIYYQTSGTQANTRKAHVKYLFDHVYK